MKDSTTSLVRLYHKDTLQPNDHPISILKIYIFTQPQRPAAHLVRYKPLPMQIHMYQSAPVNQLIRQCLRQDARAQRTLYEQFSPRMYALCLRYVRESDDAQDVLLRAFTKVFEHLPRFKGEGSFEGWVRRIVVNEALMFLRKHKHRLITVELDGATMASVEQYPQLEADDLLRLVQALPEGYRTVFNMHTIEGYAHAEIAEQLGISEGTSKSQLSRAKELLRQRITNYDRGYRDQLG